MGAMRQRSLLYVYVNRVLPAEDMEEILSDVFIKLWNNRARIEAEYDHLVYGRLEVYVRDSADFRCNHRYF